MVQETRGWIRFLTVGAILALSVSLLRVPPITGHTRTTPTADQAERNRLLGIGKKLFVERCSSCHGERGDKPLKSGPPLSERKLENQVIESAVKGRLKDRTDEQRRAVALYIESLLSP